MAMLSGGIPLVFKLSFTRRFRSRRAKQAPCWAGRLRHNCRLWAKKEGIESIVMPLIRWHRQHAFTNTTNVHHRPKAPLFGVDAMMMMMVFDGKQIYPIGTKTLAPQQTSKVYQGPSVPTNRFGIAKTEKFGGL
ncbi:hypothetical protein CPAR01_03201 [Colletotrichum paranaense]|uniref:Uncharacterized protein n=1 Tax=Colletotrichum paranaense TaxID=1914294 RepID=A0ABQ9T1T7_9PEZI|nr:uncharacterized protein CPAR01_03201 [Colletotrichum paranaense]KAK1545699.1 hypothetical protein CPAR01_03201 [Colletotrichum paranaense]